MASYSKPGLPVKTCEGVFAINKPPNISSAQVIRDVQRHFKTSALFKPWFDEEQARREAETDRSRGRRTSWKQRQPLQLKMGHGGTLDPMATGVLILGVGSGTKQLSSFLECTKTYEAVVLFGVATDSYDAVGKVVARARYGHVTKEMVETALQKFRGQIMQRPPIFSALRVQGKRLYEYAREGTQVPVEIEERQMHVEQMELLEWMEGGSHTWQWPTEIAGTPEREIAESALHLEGDLRCRTAGQHTSADAKRKRWGDESCPDAHDNEKGVSAKRARVGGSPVELSDDLTTEEAHAPALRTTTASPAVSGPCPAPACRLRMTVTSGFYVRSLCHDLGAAVGSLALMSSLVRVRQGEFELGKNVLEYSDLDKGTEEWESKVSSMLEAWHETERGLGPTPNGRGKNASPLQGKQKSSDAKHHKRANMKRRNSSSEGE